MGAQRGARADLHRAFIDRLKALPDEELALLAADEDRDMARGLALGRLGLWRRRLGLGQGHWRHRRFPDGEGCELNGGWRIGCDDPECRRIGLERGVGYGSGRGGKRIRGQGLEEARMGEIGRRHRLVRDDHPCADLRIAEQLFRHLCGQADAAVGGGSTGHMALMQGDAGPGDALHEGHWRIGVDIRAMHAFLLQQREGAARGLVSRDPGRNHRARHDHPVLPDREPLIGERDRKNDRPARLVGHAGERRRRRFGASETRLRRPGQRQQKKGQANDGQRLGAEGGMSGHGGSGLWRAR